METKAGHWEKPVVTDLCEEAMESPLLKISSAGRASINRGVISTNSLVLGQTSSRTVSQGLYCSDRMLKTQRDSPEMAMKPAETYSGMI